METLREHGTDAVPETQTRTPRERAQRNAHATDCILQLMSRDLQDRLEAYFNDPEIHGIIFPSAQCASSVENVCPSVRRRDSGKSFLQLRGITGSAAEWVQWMNSSPVRFVVTRMFFLDGGKRGDIQTAGSLEELIEQLKAHAGALRPAGPIRLQFGPRTMERVLLDRFESMGDACPFEFHPVHCTSSLHVFQYPDGKFRWSMRSMDEHYFTSPDGPTRVPGSFTKAAAKLAEALLVGGMASGIGPTREPGRGRVAVDVGASPGGWTHQLAVGQGMETVISIDPAELHESVLALENVHHVKQTSQAADEDIERILGPGRKISVLTCDANRHPSFVAEMLAPVVKYLVDGGLMVITMKFAVRRRKRKGEPTTDDNVGLLLQESFKTHGYNLTVRRFVLCRLDNPLLSPRPGRVFGWSTIACSPAGPPWRGPGPPHTSLTPSAARLTPAELEVGSAALKHVIRKDGPVPIVRRRQSLTESGG